MISLNTKECVSHVLLLFQGFDLHVSVSFHFSFVKISKLLL